MLSPELIAILGRRPGLIQCHEGANIHIVDYLGYTFIGWAADGQPTQWLQMGSLSVTGLIQSLTHHQAKANQYRVRHTGNRTEAIAGGKALL